MEEPEPQRAPSQPEKPPAYVVFKERQKESSLVKPFFLAGLMLLAVILLAPLVRLIQPKKTTVGLVDDVEPLEFQPPPVLPESVNIPVPEIPEIPQLEPEDLPEMQSEFLAENSEAVLRELNFLRDSTGMASLVWQDTQQIYPQDAVDIPARLKNREALSALIGALSSEEVGSVQIEIRSDGRAQVAPGFAGQNPETAELLNTFLSEAEFRPALKDGIPVHSHYQLSHGP